MLLALALNKFKSEYDVHQAIYTQSIHEFSNLPEFLLLDYILFIGKKGKDNFSFFNQNRQNLVYSTDGL